MVQETPELSPDLLKQIYALEGKAVPEINHSKFEDFLRSLINGDTLLDFLVIPLKLGEGRDSIGVYLLTSARVIRLIITKEGFDSTDSYLSKVTAINRSLSNKPEGGNDASVRVEFPQGAFGIRYSAGHKEIERFFANVETTVRKAKGDA